MDVFYEQLVPIPKTGKTIVLQSLLWTAGLILSGVVIFGLSLLNLFIIGCGLAFGVLYLCYKWSMNFSLEYEYIFTNGDLDIDKIIGKQKRDRCITLSADKTEKLFKYNSDKIKGGNYNKVIYACIPDEDSICLAARHNKEGLCVVVFQPEEKMLNKIKEFIPRNVLRESEI